MEHLVLTKDGLKKLEDELAYLKVTQRPAIAEKIKEAREFGDLSENSEYEAALNAQAIMEARIAYIEEQLKIAIVQDESDIDHTVVSVGSRVTVYDPDMDEEETYDIVGKTESDPQQNKISDQSPVGCALIGHRDGEEVTVLAPGGEYSLIIKNVTRF